MKYGLKLVKLDTIQTQFLNKPLKLLYVLLSFISLVIKSGNITNSALECINGILNADQISVKSQLRRGTSSPEPYTAFGLDKNVIRGLWAHLPPSPLEISYSHTLALLVPM